MRLWIFIAIVLTTVPAAAAPGASFGGTDATCELDHALAPMGIGRHESGILTCRLDHYGAVGAGSCDAAGCLVHAVVQSDARWYPVGYASTASALSTEGGDTRVVCESVAAAPTSGIVCYGVAEALRVPVAAGACTTGTVSSVVRLDDAFVYAGDETIPTISLVMEIVETYRLCRDAEGAPAVTMLT